MDRQDRAGLIEFARQQVLELDSFDLLPQGLELPLEFLEKDVAAFFFEDADRLLDIRQLVLSISRETTKPLPLRGPR
jgi:hypothetical protein